MIVEYNYSKDDILNEVDKTTAYLGAKQVSEGNLYGRISTIAEDREMLNRFFHEACAMISGIGKKFIKTSSFGEDDENFYIEYSLPESWNEAMEAPLKQDIYSFIVNYIIARWFVICGSEYAKVYSEYATQNNTNILKELYSVIIINVTEEGAINNSAGGVMPQNIGESTIEVIHY